MPGTPSPRTAWLSSALQSGLGATSPRLLIAAGAFAVLAGCSAPIGTEQAKFEDVYKQIHDNSVLAGEPSRETRSALHRFEQQEEFRKSPDTALALLRREVGENHERGLLFALAELNFLIGERLRARDPAAREHDARDYYLAAAVYAWLFLFDASPEMDEAPPGAFDHRFRVACDIYNYGLGRALNDRGDVSARARLAGGERRIPGGRITLEFGQPGFPWPLGEFDHFAVADQLLVRGLTARNRQSGIGATLVGLTRVDDATGFARAVPCTVVLRLDSRVDDVAAGTLRGSLELHSPFDQSTVEMAGRVAPLETDTTVPTAYVLNQAYVWKLGMLQFLSSEERIPTDVYLTQPYRPGRIPIVFVHGTFSSPVWWAEMANALGSDPVLSRRCQFWYFIYNSGNPVMYSAVELRESLRRKLAELDPGGTDAALRQMVVVGHSQGGLLTKLTATNTGDRLLHAVLTPGQLASLDLAPEQEQFIRRYGVFEALPFVRRVVFISTPHRGSYVANRFVQTLAHKVVALPERFADTTRELAGKSEVLDLPREVRSSPTSLDSMRPDNPALLALAEIPLAPGVAGHSIIAVRGDGDPKEGKDGLVAYPSAHLDCVESEYIVRSGHSCQDKPPTIEEVLRILREHIRSIDGAREAPGS
ncbi:MAG: alpha/beta hydrolase [Opitutaceae bacterium]|nr:alpha/beta hydrolase [Opitutaceae bacterium]